MQKKIKVSVVAARAIYPVVNVSLTHDQKHDSYSLQKLRRGK